jgi:hypothetical protein
MVARIVSGTLCHTGSRNVDENRLWLREAYNRGWMDSLSEPRPFKTARESMLAKHMKLVESVIKDD